MTSKTSTVYFVTQTNPEIFSASPRPGGIAKIDIPPKPNKLKEIAAKAESLAKSGSSKKRSSKIGGSKPKSETAVKEDTQSRKSLLTIATKYDEPKPLAADDCPREYKVKQIISATPWSVEFDEFSERTEENQRIPDPFQDSVDMLAMSISVIMLLSRGYDQISETQFKWVISYLDCIRDEFGQRPPNIQGLLNHINEMTGGKIKSYREERDDYEPDELGDRATAVRISDAPPAVA